MPFRVVSSRTAAGHDRAVAGIKLAANEYVYVYGKREKAEREIGEWIFVPP